MFWRASLQNIQTDLSHASLKKLEMLSNNPQLCCYIHHLTLKGFDENSYILGEGLEWNRHPSGHLINLQEQPAVKLLQPILCRLVNCKSFECSSISTPDHPDLADIARATDAVQVFLDIVAEASLPVASFTVNFRAHHNTGRNYLDPRRLHLAYFKKAGFVARWAHVEELTLNFTLDFEIILNWASDLILSAPNLKKLDVNLETDDNTFFLIQRLASTDSLVWPQLQELRLRHTRSSIAHLTALLHKFQQTLRILCIGVLRTDASVDDLKLFFQTLSRGFPSLEEIDFWPWWSGTGIYDPQIVHYPGVPENFMMDETEKARVKVVSRTWKRARRNRFVGYSGPQVHLVLDMLARSVELL